MNEIESYIEHIQKRLGGRLLVLGSHGGPLSGDGLETRLDALDRALGVAGHALEEKESHVLVEDGVGGAAGVTEHVLLDVLSQDRLNVPLLELALQDQLVGAVDGAYCAQLGLQEGKQVLGLTMEPVVAVEVF